MKKAKYAISKGVLLPAHPASVKTEKLNQLLPNQIKKAKNTAHPRNTFFLMFLFFFSSPQGSASGTPHIVAGGSSGRGAARMMLTDTSTSSAYVSIKTTSAYVSMRQHTSAYAHIRPHTSAYVRVPERYEHFACRLAWHPLANWRAAEHEALRCRERPN